MTTATTDYSRLTLSQLARVVRRDWRKPFYGAVPYLDAMGTLTDLSDNYYFDTGDSVVRYFLANATTWRGETARAVKAELRRRLAGGKRVGEF